MSAHRIGFALCLGLLVAPVLATKPARPAAGAVVVVAGASGKTGRLVVREALDAGYRVRALTSDPDRARADLGAALYDRAEWRRVDVRDAAGVRQALRGADYVISAIGARVFDGPASPEFIDYGGNVHLIDAARQSSVRRFVLISSAAAGTHRDQSQAPMLGYVRKWKTAAEEHLKRSGIAYAIIGPAGLLDTPARRDGLRAIRREDYVSTNVSRGDVARVAIDALVNPDATGRSFALIGDRAGDPEAWRADLRSLPRDGERAQPSQPSAVAAPRLDQLAWMAGHWASSGERGGWSEEIWLAPQSTLMPGLNREVRENGSTSFEYLRIEQRGDGRLVYVASPGGGAPTDFPLVELRSMHAVFENPAHDFPRRLTYWREGKVLRARAEGSARDRPVTIEYRWTLRREP